MNYIKLWGKIKNIQKVKKEQGGEGMKKRLARLFCLVFFAVFCVFYGQDVQAAGGKVYVSVEKFTLGQGYLVEPTCVSFQEGENYAQIFERLMRSKGYTYEANKTTGFYLSAIHNADAGKVKIPEIIAGDQGFQGIEKTSPNADGSLGEFAYTNASGWMYEVNGRLPGVGMNGLTAKDGDVCRIHFSLYWGNDVGAPNEDPELSTPIFVLNKDRVTRKMAQINQRPEAKKNAQWKAAYDRAVAVVSDLDRSAAEIARAEAALPSAAEMDAWIAGQNIQENQSGQNIQKNEQKQDILLAPKLKKVKKAGNRKIRLTWNKVKGCGGYQIFMSGKKAKGYKKIATVRKAKKITYIRSGLKQKKTYYFKVRTFKHVSGKTYYSAFSNVKKIRVK